MTIHFNYVPILYQIFFLTRYKFKISFFDMKNQSKFYQNSRWKLQDQIIYQGRIQWGGGRTRPAPPLKLDKIWFFGVKSWFFTRNIPNIFAPPSARRNVFKCARPQLGILDPPLYIVVVYVRSSYIVFYNSWQMKVYTSIAFPTQIVQQGSGEGVTRYILMYASWKQTHCLDQTSRCWVELV